MSTSKKLKSEQLFVRVETVMHDLQISRPFAYRMIAGWNEELKEQGYTTIVTPKLTEDLKKPFKLEGGVQRIDDTPVHKAVR